MLKSIAEQIPIEGRVANVAVSTALFLAINPWASLASLALRDIRTHAHWASFFPGYIETIEQGLLVSTAVIGPYLLAKLLHSKGSVGGKKELQRVKLGGMVWNESDLFTNIMITGLIGSGKTSSAIYPILEQLLEIYKRDTEDNTDQLAKLGGLVLDVKGDFYEALITKMYKKGRNPLEDLIIITPLCDYHYIELTDPATNFSFFISARGGSSEFSNELFLLVKGQKAPDPVTGEPTGRQLPTSVFTNDREADTPLFIGATKTMRDHLTTLEFKYTKNQFLGWRDVNGKLRRVKCTNPDRTEEFYKDANDRYIEIDPPKTLRYVRTRMINNGLTFNICPPSLEPIELANRLIAMSKNASGKGGDGGNAFWDDATKKHLAWVVKLWREIKPREEVTAIHLNRMTVDQEYITENVKLLGEFVSKQKAIMLRKEGSERIAMEAQLQILQDMHKYFEKEWGELDERTKSNLISTITNVFGSFMQDSKLRSVFCVPSTVRIDETMQSGKIFTLVAPGYESAARVFGTSLKMEFQKLMLQRVANPIYNKLRFILFMCDEAQNFVTAGGNDPTSGDENFMALSRQSRVCNIIATQSDNSIVNVIGDKSAPVYYQQFGSRIWYQNTDEKTNKTAEFILGTIKKEKTSRSGSDFQTASIFQKDSSAKGYSEQISVEEKKRFPAETFSNLNVHECVIYNKAKLGNKDKACRNKVIPDSLGSKEGIVEKNSIVRWYFRSYIENRLLKVGESSVLNHTRELATEVIVSDTGTVVATTSAPSSSIPLPKSNSSKVVPDFTQESTPTPLQTSVVTTETPSIQVTASEYPTVTDEEILNSEGCTDIFPSSIGEAVTVTYTNDGVADKTSYTEPMILATFEETTEDIAAIAPTELKLIQRKITTGQHHDKLKTFIELVAINKSATYDAELHELNILFEQAPNTNSLGGSRDIIHATSIPTKSTVISDTLKNVSGLTTPTPHTTQDGLREVVAATKVTSPLEIIPGKVVTDAEDANEGETDTTTLF